MSLLPDPTSELLGEQRPRVYSVPPYVETLGDKAIELAASCGLYLDQWQQLVLTDMLGRRDDGKWAAFEAALVVARQNGKGDVLAARELAGLFIIPEERLLVHSAHQFDTSLEAFERLVTYILRTPDLRKRIRGYRGEELDPRGISRSHGTEGITLKNGKRIRFRTRTKGGGRGFTGDLVVFDEAMIIADSMFTALLPIVSARPNPQIVYAGSAVDQEIHEYGIQLARVRERGHAGGDESLAYFEWSAADSFDQITAEQAVDPAVWARANPALGIRISHEYVANERRSFASNLRGFVVERLGGGDWPRTDIGVDGVISREAWIECIDTASMREGPVSFAFDTPPDRSSTSICVAGKRADGRPHVEVVEQGPGTGWVPARLAELTKVHKSTAVILDGSGPAGSLLPELERLRVKVVTVTAKEHAQACGMFFDSVEQRALRHLGTPEMLAAIDGAVKRPLTDSWAWSRKNSNVDISPLVACTLALWGIETQKPRSRARLIDTRELLRGDVITR